MSPFELSLLSTSTNIGKGLLEYGRSSSGISTGVSKSVRASFAQLENPPLTDSIDLQITLHLSTSEMPRVVQETTTIQTEARSLEDSYLSALAARANNPLELNRIRSQLRSTLLHSRGILLQSTSGFKLEIFRFRSEIVFRDS